MVFPVNERKSVNYQAEQFEQLLVDKFTGGLNITDPVVNLPPDQFTSFLNIFHNRQGTIKSRPPFRPVTFSGSIQDKNVIVDYDFAGDMFRIKTLHNYQVFRETLSNGWSFNDEVHVVSGVFEKIVGAVGEQFMVVVYNSSDEKWTMIWNKSASSVTAVSVCSYKINKAFDLILFPNDGNPERWAPSSAVSGGVADIIGVTSDLGLAAPAVGAFTAVLTEADNSAGFTRAFADTVYYKFAYFYDDSNVTTKFGESSTTAITSTRSEVLSVTTDKGQISIAFTDVAIPSTVSKVRIYRAPLNEVAGPYQLIGETEVSSADGAGGGTITTFVDETEWGAEGAEDLPAGSNPSLSGSDLETINVQTVGPYLVGFDNSMKHKLIWCDTGKPDVWHPLNFDYLGNEGKAVIEFNRKIYAFTSEGCYQKDTMESTASKISNIGCIDGRTLQDVGYGLVWMDYDTVYFANFVQEYGAKGDFPLDIGHNISKSILRRSDSFQVNSAFFERRYYLTYVDTEDFLPRTYVYDVDWTDWHEHSAKHLAWSRGNRSLFSLGETTITRGLSANQKITDAGGGEINVNLDAHGLSDNDWATGSGTTDHDATFEITIVDADNFKFTDTYVEDKTSGSFTITKTYVYEHDYEATVAVVSGFSEYAGKDFHDYNRVAQTVFHGISNQTITIGRENLRLAGDFRKIFASSLSIEAEGSIIDIDATISSEDAGFSVTKNFSSGSNEEVITQFAFVFDESVFAAGTGNEAADGDADEAGFAGFSSASAALHKKIKRIIKSNAIGIKLTSTDARGLSILYIVLYWKPYPMVA